MRFGPIEALVLLIVVLLFFGARKAPKAAEALGKSVKIFKKEVSKDVSEEETEEQSEEQTD